MKFTLSQIEIEAALKKHTASLINAQGNVTIEFIAKRKGAGLTAVIDIETGGVQNTSYTRPVVQQNGPNPLAEIKTNLVHDYNYARVLSESKVEPPEVAKKYFTMDDLRAQQAADAAANPEPEVVEEAPVTVEEPDQSQADEIAAEDAEVEAEPNMSTTRPSLFANLTKPSN